MRDVKRTHSVPEAGKGWNRRWTNVHSNYEVLVVGGGHAGAEAAAAAARLGARVLLITPDLARIGQMSCNPAIGGIAKGVVAREVDALGGVMGRATDAARIHFRMLNRSKGPAVWGPRAQCDRGLYSLAVRRALEELPKLDLFQDMVQELTLRGDRVTGVRTRAGLEFTALAVVITAGTFLRGRIHIGRGAGVEGGRAGEEASVELASALEGRGLEVARFKTGTPPRIDGRSVDYSQVEEQPSEPGAFRFSGYTREEFAGERPCWITWTGPELRDVVQENLERSARFGGSIAGRGPRYCPSIEDKVVRFPDARRHQVFLEPEGLDTTELYVNGLSTSLPPDVQLRFLRTVPGLERVRMTRLGYAIEYDYFLPHQLRHTLEVKAVERLFFAGQINGTTGYEEAAGQGLVAGANAALAALGEASFILERDQAYIGVLIDDLVTKGVDEPYRLFTSRAEFRLLLRQDNALTRLGPLARNRGLLSAGQVQTLEERLDQERRLLDWFTDTRLRPDQVNETLAMVGSSPVRAPTRAVDLLKRPGVKSKMLVQAARVPFLADGCEDALLAVEVDLKYRGYVQRERERAATLRARADFRIPEDLEYAELRTLSHEAREKLSRIRPTTLAQASRVSGVSPADLQNLVLEVRKSAALSDCSTGNMTVKHFGEGRPVPRGT